MAGGVVHSARSSAPGTEAASIAAQRDELAVAAVATAHPQEAASPDAALEEGVKRVFDYVRQVGAGSVAGMAKKVAACCGTRRCSVVCSAPVALVVNRGAIRRLLGLPANGLHARSRDPVRSQALRCDSIALYAACPCLLFDAGPPTGA